MLIRKKILIFNLLFLLLTVFLFSQELEITYPKGGERFSNGDRIKNILEYSWVEWKFKDLFA